MRMRRVLRPILVATAALAAFPAAALDMRSVAGPALLYDAPSAKAEPKFIVAPGTPVEVVITLDKWVKVRDAGGALLWIERDKLSEKPRNVIVTAARAEIRKSADDNAPLAFEAARDVLLEVVEPAAAGWAKVRHRDGQSGYVRANQVWGL